MKTTTIVLWGLIGILLVSSCRNKPVQTVGNKKITNPILPGFYPDPSICKGADGYYMVNSTFSYFPGIPIFYSPDMVHWKQIGNVLTRPEQLQVEGQGITNRGTYAPTIEYHNETYYVTCTEVGNRGNYIVTAKKPEGPWSDLNLLPEVKGIDPSLFFDDDGKTYVIYNSDAPNNKPEYQGHRTIRINELDIENMKVIGDNKILVNGGVDITKKPVWIEGPHMYKVNGMYYVCAAEGGTSVNHSQVILRSENIMGPFEPWDKNPILTQRDLDPNRPDPITSTGHADMIQDLNGDWWAVFLACRPYTGNHYNLGRETFMAPVSWAGGWPTINPNHKEVQKNYTFTAAKETPTTYMPLNGAFSYTEEFKKDTLDFTWLTIRSSDNSWYNIDTTELGSLNMSVLPYDLIHDKTPSFLGKRQQHKRGHVTTQLSFSPEKEGDKAGLVIFQNIGHYYFICKSIKESKPVVQLIQSEGESYTVLNSKPLKCDASIQLKIEVDNDVYRCFYAVEDGNWLKIGEDLDAKLLSTQTAGGFTGCLYGLYAFTDENTDKLKAKYNWFKYVGLE